MVTRGVANLGTLDGTREYTVRSLGELGEPFQRGDTGMVGLAIPLMVSRASAARTSRAC